MHLDEIRAYVSDVLEFVSSQVEGVNFHFVEDSVLRSLIGRNVVSGLCCLAGGVTSPRGGGGFSVEASSSGFFLIFDNPNTRALERDGAVSRGTSDMCLVYVSDCGSPLEKKILAQFVWDVVHVGLGKCLHPAQVAGLASGLHGEQRNEFMAALEAHGWPSRSSAAASQPAPPSSHP